MLEVIAGAMTGESDLAVLLGRLAATPLLPAVGIRMVRFYPVKN